MLLFRLHPRLEDVISNFPKGYAKRMTTKRVYYEKNNNPILGMNKRKNPSV